MKRIENIATMLCRFGTGLAFLVLIAAVLTQVLGRTFGSSPVWTEELTRYAMLFMVAFGAGLAFRTGDLVNVDVVCEALPDPWPRWLRLLSAATTFCLCSFLATATWKFVSIGAMQTSPALGVRMDVIHFSVLALLLLLAVFAALRVGAMLLLRESGHPVRSEE